MNYEEFRNLDQVDAYAEFTSVLNAKELNYITPDYDDIIPNKCLCGSDMIINNESTTLMCCNPRCFLKMGYSLNNMLKKFECKGLGPETCVAICKYGIENGIFVIPSYVEVLSKYESFKGLLGHRYDDLVHAVYKMHTTPMKFYQMIQYIGIPGFDKVCKDYFGSVSNFDDLLSKLNEHSIVSYLAQFGVADLKKSLNLQIYLKDIRAFEILYRGEISRPALKHLDIVITGRVAPEGREMTRKEFIAYCNSLSVIDGVPLYDFHTSTALQSARYFICDSPSGTNKYNIARQREQLNPGLKLIYTSQEFVDLIRNEVNKCRELIEKNKMKL